MPSTPIEISQPEGLTMLLSRKERGLLRTELKSTLLHAVAITEYDPKSLCDFFEQAAKGTAAPYGKWEFKDDEDLVLHASPDPHEPGHILIAIDMLAGGTDGADWQVKATICIPLDHFRERASAVIRHFQP